MNQAIKTISDRLEVVRDSLSRLGESAALALKLDCISSRFDPERTPVVYRDEMSDVQAAVLTIIGEAEDQGDFGMFLVARVIANRWLDPHRRGLFGHRKGGRTSVAEVVMKPAQFSCWWDEECRERMYSRGSALYLRAAAAWIVAAMDSTDDPTDAATHYHVASMQNPPAWRKSPKMTRTITFGAHAFYREEP